MSWELVFTRMETDALPIDLFIKSISMSSETKFVPGDAVFPDWYRYCVSICNAVQHQAQTRYCMNVT